MKTNYANRPIGIPTEEDRLVRQAKSSNAYAFAQLYDACVEQVYRYVSFRVANDRVAEAVTIQVFFKAWEQLGQYQAFGSSFIMWLYSIARNQVIAYYLKRKQLKPLLQTAFLLDHGAEVMPSPTFAAFARFAVIEYARSHPRQQRGIRQQRGVALSWRMAMTLAMLVVALLVTGTVHAQSALPGDIDYGWKRTSELAWRALAPDPVAADIILSERRLNEWIAVANDPALSTSAMKSYQDALSKLKSTDDVEALALVMPVLQLQQQTLNDAGLSTSVLDNYLIEVENLLSDNVPTQIAPTENAPTAIEVPIEIIPTAAEIPPTDDAPTEVPSTEVAPTDVAPTDVAPTDVAPTDVSPTEVPPTDVPPTDVPALTDEPLP
jgi:DNA-directed RNA polymerase specialized sigma24 family protein